jgi:hypothetical protein
MSEGQKPMAGVTFPWEYLDGLYLCLRSFAPWAEVSGDSVGSPYRLPAYGLVEAELPNPDVEPGQRLVTLPIKHKSDYKSLYRAHLDAGVKTGSNELILLYEHRKGLFGGHKASFHLAAYLAGTWQSFFHAVDNYASNQFQWPTALFLYQPSSRTAFPAGRNIFRP